MPHSEIRGSTGARPSPRLIAACHVLHRLSVPRHPPDALLTLDLSIPIPSRKHAPTDTKARTPLGWITHIHRPQNTPTPPAHAARGKIPKRPGRPSAIRTLQSPTACHARQTATSPVRTKGRTHRVCPPVDDQPLHHVQKPTATRPSSRPADLVSSHTRCSAVRSRSLSSDIAPRRAWWSQTGSNRRPPACKAGALPAELWPLILRQRLDGGPG